MPQKKMRIKMKDGRKMGMKRKGIEIVEIYIMLIQKVGNHSPPQLPVFVVLNNFLPFTILFCLCSVIHSFIHSNQSHRLLAVSTASMAIDL